MRDLRLLDAFRVRGERVREFYGWDGDETCGAFMMPSPIDRGDLVIIASAEGAGITSASPARTVAQLG